MFGKKFRGSFSSLFYFLDHKCLLGFVRVVVVIKKISGLMSLVVRNCTPPLSSPIYNSLRNPSSILSFQITTSYAEKYIYSEMIHQGLASELFQFIVQKPKVVQITPNGEMQSNLTNITTQFLAELRVYTILAWYQNITAFLHCFNNVDTMLKFVDGRTVHDALRQHERRFIDI